MRRDHVTATQLADFWRCPRKAFFTDRLSPDLKDPVAPLQEMIFRAGDAFEEQVVSEIPGVVALDRKALGLEKAHLETKRLMAQGVPAIHHGILLGKEDGIGYVAESDLLIRDPGDPPRYRLREIKNSAHPSSPQAMQLALNIWLLRQTGFASENHEIWFRGGSAPLSWGDVDGVFHQSRLEFIQALNAAENPIFQLKPACSGCEWRSNCHQAAHEAKDLGFLPNLSSRERSLFANVGIFNLDDLLKTPLANPFQDRDPRFVELVTRARAFHEKKRLPVPSYVPLPKWNENTWLLHLGKDLPVTKEVILWAGVRLGGQDGFSVTGPGALSELLAFFTRYPREPFFTTTDGTLSSLRDDILPRHALGDPETIHRAISVERLLMGRFAWPMAGPHLGDFIAWHRQDSLPVPDPLEVHFSDPQQGPAALLHLLRETRLLLRETPWP